MREKWSPPFAEGGFWISGESIMTYQQESSMFGGQRNNANLVKASFGFRVLVLQLFPVDPEPTSCNQRRTGKTWNMLHLVGQSHFLNLSKPPNSRENKEKEKLHIFGRKPKINQQFSGRTLFPPKKTKSPAALFFSRCGVGSGLCRLVAELDMFNLFPRFQSMFRKQVTGQAFALRAFPDRGSQYGKPPMLICLIGGKGEGVLDFLLAG